MRVTPEITIEQILKACPECEEFLYPFLEGVSEHTTLKHLAEEKTISLKALMAGIERYIKRSTQNPCDYTSMRRGLIKTGKVNIAGFTHFLLQDSIVEALRSEAAKKNIPLNLNLFPKHQKKYFQNYLAQCSSPDDLPDLLIGKGFSSLMSSRFYDKFVRPGFFKHPIKSLKNKDVNELYDKQEAYHIFGLEETVMVYDHSVQAHGPKPKAWKDIMNAAYPQALTQMGKNGQDHFGFNILLYLYLEYGEAGIVHFASKVKNKQHFAYTIRHLGKKSERVAPVNIMHRHASRFIRSEAKNTTEIIAAAEGNPCSCYFFLLKHDAPQEAYTLAKQLLSERLQLQLEHCGITPISAISQKPFQWVGWETLANLPLPYLKEQLAELAFNHYQKPSYETL